MDINKFKIGESYNYYDNGVFSGTRLYSVKITDIIKFKDANKIDGLIEFWRSEVKFCPNIYNKETEYFIEGLIDIGDDELQKVYFVKHRYNESLYFSIDTSGDEYCGWLTDINEHENF